PDHRPSLAQLLNALAATMPSLTAIPAAEQNTVVQTSHQWQRGDGLAPGQSQSAAQVNTSVQSRDALLTGRFRSALGGYLHEAVNQTDQGIWQLQIGCLAFRAQTQQFQRAEQSNTTFRS